jgi:glycosyltransferase involved in cell wall biosynthesis
MRLMGVPEVSILMPVFNAAQTLKTALDSIRGQDFESWELLAVDDGSSDDSLEILVDCAREDPRIHPVRMEHRGIVDALQAAATQARGKFLARMDADDVSGPQRLRLQLACFASDPGLGLCGGRVCMIGDRVGSGRRRYEQWINALVNHQAIAREIFVECPLPHPTFMISRSWYDRIGGYQECPWPEDYDIVMRLLLAGARFAKPDAVILNWHDHPGRLSMNDPRYEEAAFRALKRHYLAQLPARMGRPLYQWGAGEVGKRWLREWGSAAPVAVVDINSRKIGRVIHGLRVIAPEELPSPGACFIVIMVGTPGARDDIRDRLHPRGFRECEDYLFLA